MKGIEEKKKINKSETKQEDWKKRFRGQKRKGSIAYATTVGLAVMNYREEKGRCWNIRKDDQIGQEWNSNLETKESTKELNNP